MHFGLLISLALHAGLLAWALWAVHTTPQLVPDTPPIDVAIITASELTRLRQGDPDSKQLTAKAEQEPDKEISKKEAEKPKPVTAPAPAAAPPPAPETPKPEPPKPEPPRPEPEKKAEPEKPDPIAEKIAAIPPPAPGPTPDDLKKLEEQKQADEAARKAEEQRKADAQKKAEEEARKAEEKRKADEAKKRKREEERKKRLAEAKRKAAEEKKKQQQFDPDRIAALLDKTPDKKGAPQRSNAPDPDATYKGPTAGTRDGNDTQLSAREQDLILGQIRQQLQPCTRPPGGGGGEIDPPVVNVEWRMRPDGSVEGEPTIVGVASRNPLWDEASVRAVKECSPITLPAGLVQRTIPVSWAFDWPRILGVR